MTRADDSPGAAPRSSRRSTPTARSTRRALRALVDWQIEEGIHFLVPCGSTGEAATMTIEEHRRVVEIVVEQANGRVPIVAGAGSNDTQKAIALSQGDARRRRDAPAAHVADVQQAAAARHRRALPRDRRSGRPADRRLQRARAHGRATSRRRRRSSWRGFPASSAVKEASGQLSQIADIIRGAARSSPSSPATTRSRCP